MSGHWELGRNLHECTFTCHLCGMGGFPNTGLLDQHCMVTCPHRDNEIDWGDNPDEWLERSTVRSEGSVSNENLNDHRDIVDPALDTTTSVEELKCPICFDRKVALVSACGHCVCHTCCKSLAKKEIDACPSCRKPWSENLMRPLYI